VLSVQGEFKNHGRVINEWSGAGLMPARWKLFAIHIAQWADRMMRWQMGY
jgi:hypothetical protein